MRKSTFLILCLEGAVLSFNVAASAALVPSIAREFVLSQFAAGRIIWAYMLPYGIAALIYGPLIRAIDARKIELGCILLFSLANFLAASAVNIESLLVARFLMGLFGASVIPLGLILISRHIDEKKRGSYVGIFFAATFAASLSGLLLSSFINWRLIYLIPALCGLVLFLIMYLGLPSFQKDAPGFSMNYLSAFRDKRIIVIFSYIFLISLAYHAVQQWLAVYFSLHLGLAQMSISLLLTLTSFSGIVGEGLGGVSADKIGRIKTIELGLMLMAVSVFALIFKMNVWCLGLVLLAWGLGWTINHAGLSTLLCDLPPKFINEAAGLNSGIRFISGGIGVTLGGILMQKSYGLNFAVFGIGLVLIGVFAKKILVVKSGG